MCAAPFPSRTVGPLTVYPLGAVEPEDEELLLPAPLLLLLDEDDGFEPPLLLLLELTPELEP